MAKNNFTRSASYLLKEVHVIAFTRNSTYFVKILSLHQDIFTHDAFKHTILNPLVPIHCIQHGTTGRVQSSTRHQIKTFNIPHPAINDQIFVAAHSREFK